MTSTLTHIKFGIAGFLAAGALAIVISPSFGATVIDSLTVFTSGVAAATADFMPAPMR